MLMFSGNLKAPLKSNSREKNRTSITKKEYCAFKAMERDEVPT